MKTLKIFIVFIIVGFTSKGQSTPIDFYKVFKNFDYNFIDEMQTDCSTALIAKIRTSKSGNVCRVSILENDTSHFAKCILQSLKKLKKTDQYLKPQNLVVYFVYVNESVVCDVKGHQENSSRLLERAKKIGNKSKYNFLGPVYVNSGVEEQRKY